MKCRSLKIAFCFLLGLMPGIMAACGPSAREALHPSAGKLFRQRWWNHYVRALEAAERQVYDAALTDLELAVQQREHDQRMARTYGMHFIDYFPHRELGIIYWLRGNLACAREELESSIRQYPTAKALFYLDEVRKALLHQKGVRGGPPQLYLLLPETPFWTRDDPVCIGGRAVDPNYVSALSVDGAPVHMPGSQQEVTFEHCLALPQGAHRVDVKAANLLGLSTQRPVDVHVDRQGPFIVVERISDRGAEIVIDGTIFDDAGVTRFEVNQTPLPVISADQSSFSFRMSRRQPALRIEAEDRLGNVTTAHAEPADWLSALQRPMIVAVLKTTGLFERRDASAPVIRIEEWTETQTVYMDRVVVSGSVRDDRQVADLTINGTAVLPRPGAMAFFSHFIALQPGSNTITVRAVDAAGNPAQQQFCIERKLPAAMLFSERLRLTLMPFADNDATPSSDAAFQDNFVHQMVQRRRFQIVEREHLDLILQEHKINRTHLIDPATALQIGRLSAAHVFAAGSLVKTRMGIEAISRIVDTETGEVLETTDAYAEDNGLSGLKALAETLALKIHREFPLANGTVLQKQGGMIATDLGPDEIRAQRRLIVYREIPVHFPGSGRRAGSDFEVLGHARVVQCQERVSKAELQDDCSPDIGVMHKVITQ
ncbi:MAG: hypothetical protein C4519_11585 [Desulfobacteraceae bacterium]|nr:MAG: hypothetical protein C4519_11585 [Desulfobacteraceae bacterium]